MTLAVVVPLARLVPLRLNVVGQARALSLLGCPTVPPIGAFRPCERSGRQHAPVARTRVIQFLPSYEKEDKKVGQWGDAPNLDALRSPTSFLKGGTHGTAQQQQIAEGCIRRHSLGVHLALPTYSPGGIKVGLLP
jgi:hypothetical protein